MSFLWPIIMVISANLIYNICTKQLPNGANEFAYLTAAYSIAAIISFLLFLFNSGGKNIVRELLPLGISPFVFGAMFVALELGYIYAYRIGWKISTASLTANISLAILLVIAGIILYKESISIKQLIGMGICAAGLILISK